MLRITQHELAAEAGLNRLLIARLELEQTSARQDAMSKLVDAFGRLGVEFIESERGSGVILLTGSRLD
jgi:predicted transcriptional regulator